MNLFTAIFGDRYAQKFGQALLEYFESEDFPKELLQYPELNVLYCEVQQDKACRAGSPEGRELKELDSDKKKQIRDLLWRKFSGSGVENLTEVCYIVG